jgi:hypothetical protein
MLSVAASAEVPTVAEAMADRCGPFAQLLARHVPVAVDQALARDSQHRCVG